jgi:hypothetical protein
VLGPDERLIVDQNEDGAVTIGVAPANSAESETGEPEVTPPAEAMRHHHGARQRTSVPSKTKMSWERDPSTGGVTFLPDEGETIFVDGDAVQAVVSTSPTPPQPPEADLAAARRIRLPRLPLGRGSERSAGSAPAGSPCLSVLVSSIWFNCQHARSFAAASCAA